MPNYSDNGKLRGGPCNTHPTNAPEEAIQIQRRRSSTRRALVHQDPDESFDELYARRRPSSTYDYATRSQSVGYDDRGRRPSRVVEEAVVQRRYNSVSDQGMLSPPSSSSFKLPNPRSFSNPLPP